MLFLVGLVLPGYEKSLPRWLASGVYVVMQFILAFMTASESDSCWWLCICGMHVPGGTLPHFCSAHSSS